MGEFSTATIPAGLLKDHTLKAGTWAQIVVLSGQLRYTIAAGKRWRSQKASRM